MAGMKRGISSSNMAEPTADYEDTETASSTKPVLKEKSLMHTSNKKIFIGPAFQADIDPVFGELQKEHYERAQASHEILLWEPSDGFSNAKLNALVDELKPRGFDEDQILSYLHYQLHRTTTPRPTTVQAIDATLQALNGVYVGKQEGMPLHDKVLFVQGYGFHGKNFDKIHDLVPNHSLQSLVNHYYTEFKRGKQVKVPATKPETDVRKLTTASALGLVPDVSNYRLSAYGGPSGAGEKGGAGSSSVKDLVAARMKILEEFDEDARDVPRMAPAARSPRPSFYVNGNGVDELDTLTIAVDDPTGRAELDERSRLERATLASVAAAEALAGARADSRPELSVEDQDDIAAAVKETEKDPTPVWQQEEIMIFMRSLVHFGTDFAKSSLLLPSKTEQQVRNMYYNRAYFYGLDKLVKIHAERTAMSATAAE